MGSRERIARTLFEHRWPRHDWKSASIGEANRYRAQADAVLAVLQDEYAQVGFLAIDKGMFVTATGPLRGTDPPEGWVPVFVKREADSNPTVELGADER